MIEQRRGLNIFSHCIVIFGIIIILFPLYIALVTASLNNQQVFQVPMPLLPSTHLWENISYIWLHGINSHGLPFSKLLLNSIIMALGITLGKITISILSAYAIVFFRFPLRNLIFGVIFITLMLPVEVRIFPTIDIVANLNMLNSYAGLILPVITSTTATFLFRQLFMTIPYEILDSARIDGTGPLRFLWDMVLPLSKTHLAALFVIIFIYGWNQYLWPTLIISDISLDTAVAAIKSMIVNSDEITQWNLVMSAMLLTMIIPIGIMLLMQRIFIHSIIGS